MNLETLHQYLLGKLGAVEDRPFDPELPAYKVMGKMFALIWAQDDPPRLNLKCDPFHAELLRETFSAVNPGYHMNKRHWNTVTLDGSVPDDVLKDMIDESYDLVVSGLTRAAQAKLGALA
ncbi:MAG TPA: MmcQ/YjbR family DNA-binding protein [Candidatus Heimdallarchaeota archaeon]|nr:MmcQ/YjbR family DNA-binding protein [Candidatus Heimdallarchaeota archaeon]